LAGELAEEAITLLKNDGSLLPLHPSNLPLIAVIGPNAEVLEVTGGGSSRVKPPHVISPLIALREKLEGKAEVMHAVGCGYESVEHGDQEQIGEAVELAKRASAVVLFAGMPENFETEDMDRPHMRLPGAQDELIRQVAMVNQNTVVVLNCGSPVEMPWLEQVHAVVQMYYPGMQGGEAVARILLGEVNPSGKLTVTYPRRLEDTPAYLNYPGGRDVIYGEEVFVGYRYYEKKGVEPLFPFGHGLSYTTFEYGAIQTQQVWKAGEIVHVELTVKNSGDRAGKEVVQLYVRDEESSVPRPFKELKGFAKVSLDPGESKTIVFELDRRAFTFYDTEKRGWVIEPGKFELLIGSSSKDIRARAGINLTE
jgi:beta-glucosidase